MSVPALGLSSRWFARPLILAVAALLTLFAAAGFLGLQYWSERKAASLSLERSRQVLDTLDRLRTIVANVESERRGYLLTLDPAYLKAYGVSDESVRRETHALQALVANDPLQSLRAGHLAATVSAKLREIDDIVGTAQTSRLPGLAMIRIMDEMRSQIDQMVDHERFLLADLETRADALEQRKTWLIAAAVVIVGVLAGAALALARLEARRRRKATEENVQLQSNLEERDKKIRRLVDANIIGIIIWDIEGRILDANDAFLRMVGFDRDDLVSGRISRTDLTPAEWRGRDTQTIADLQMIGTVQPFEKEYFRKDRSRVPVLIGGTLFEGSESHGVGFVLDLTERKRAEQEHERLRQLETDLAHLNRLGIMGELTASLAHEILHPIATTRNNARAGMRFLEMSPPNLGEVMEALACVVRDADRGRDIVGRIRDHVKKAPPRKELFDLNEAIDEVIVMVRYAIDRNRVAVDTHLKEGTISVRGDRVQLQQVVLNLILNAVEAMSSVEERPRKLSISTELSETNGILVAVRDSGPGIDPEHLDLVFKPFHTTKPSGMGMGLSICRSIIDTHGGRLWVDANQPQGAAFQFTLPAVDEGS